MLDLKDIRKDPEKYRTGMKNRGQDPGVIDELLELDAANRAIQTIKQTAQSQRNKLSDKYGRLKGLQKKGATTYEEDEEVRDIEIGLKYIELEQMMVDIDEGLAVNDARIAHYDVEQARMVEGFAALLGFANADELVEAMKKEASEKTNDKS